MGISGLGQLNMQKTLALKNKESVNIRHVETSETKAFGKNGSIFDLKPETSQTKSANSTQNSQQEYSASEGNAAVTQGKTLSQSAKTGTEQVKKGENTAQNLGSQSKKLSKQVKSDESKMKKELKLQEKQYLENTKSMRDLARKTENEELEIRTLQAQIEDISNSSSPDAEQKLSGLNSQLNIRTTRVRAYGSRITKLHTSSNRTIRTMNRVSKNYNKSISQTQKTIQANQSKSNDILNVAGKVAEISQYTSLAGQGIQIIAKGMRALGEIMCACVYTAAAGAALITASAPVESAGVVVETVGNYGSAAASVTQSVCYAVEGDITSAVSSGMMAAMSTAAAVKNTKEIASGFQSIKAETAAAKASGEQATEAAKEVKANKKQAKTNNDPKIKDQKADKKAPLSEEDIAKKEKIKKDLKETEQTLQTASNIVERIEASKNTNNTAQVKTKEHKPHSIPTKHTDILNRVKYRTMTGARRQYNV